MGVYTRPDSPFWWLYLETTHQKEKTSIPVGPTPAHRRDSRRLAEDRYHQRMSELAARLYKLPSARPEIRFENYAEQYAQDVLPLRRGTRREGELLQALVADLGRELLSRIDADRVRAYMTRRVAQVSARTVNREIDLLKGMLRDAAPKYLNVSPIVGLRRLHVVTPKRRLMTTAEERRLLQVGDVVDRALLILGVDTLIRLGDLLDLKRADRHGRYLYVADPKGGEPYEAALSPRAARALDRLRGDEPYYFAKFRKAANPRDWPSSVRQRFEYLCREAGLVYGKKAGGLTFHWSTRRTGATRLLVKRRVPLPVVQAQGNWKTPDVLLDIYAQTDRRDLLKAVSCPSPSRARRRRA